MIRTAQPTPTRPNLVAQFAVRYSINGCAPPPVSSQATASRRASSISAWSRTRSPTRSVGRPGLPRAEEVARTAQRQVAFGDHEAVSRLDQRLEARSRAQSERSGTAARRWRRVRRGRRVLATGAAARGRTVPRARRSSSSRSARRRRLRRRSWPPARARRLARTPPSRDPSRPASGGRAAARRGTPETLPRCRWSAMAVAARRSTFSDSSTSG